STNTHKTAVGFVEACALGMGTFAGQAVDQTSLLLRYTFTGDSNLDGAVNTFDFTALADHFNGATQLCSDGDLNYDGILHALDFNRLAANYGQTLPAPALGAVVPEPFAIGFAVIAVLGGRTRRTRTAPPDPSSRPA